MTKVMLKSMVVLLVFLLFVELGCSTCAGPVALPVNDVRLSSNGTMRGVSMTLGTPPVSISLMPQGYLNDTWVYAQNSSCCNAVKKNATTNQCITLRGGLYDPSSSSSCKWSPNVESTWADPTDVSHTIGTQILNSSWFNDNLAFEGIVIESFPIGIPGFDINGMLDTQHNLGMGMNSTLLLALQAAGRIMSRSYALWWGRTGTSGGGEIDGSLVLGGYDKAKTVGDPYIQQLQTPSADCESGMQVAISDLILNFPNGTQGSILDRSEVSGCLHPDYDTLMILPQYPYYNNFESLTLNQSLTRREGAAIKARGTPDSPNAMFAGSLTMKFNRSFDVNISNDLVVVPQLEVASNGSVIEHSNNLETTVDPMDSSVKAETVILGRLFLSAAYLFVDYDAGTFSLWTANATTEQELVPVGGDCASMGGRVTTTGTSAPNSLESNGDDKPHGPAAGRVSPGAIGGAVIGSIGGAGALLLVALLYKRRRTPQDNKAVPEVLCEAMSREIRELEADATSTHKSLPAVAKAVTLYRSGPAVRISRLGVKRKGPRTGYGSLVELE